MYSSINPSINPSFHSSIPSFPGSFEVYALLSHSNFSLHANITTSSNLTAQDTLIMPFSSGSLLKYVHVFKLQQTGLTYSLRSDDSKFVSTEVGVTIVQVVTVGGEKLKM